jgi:hypothetical protein
MHRRTTNDWLSGMLHQLPDSIGPLMLYACSPCGCATVSVQLCLLHRRTSLRYFRMVAMKNNTAKMTPKPESTSPV